MEVELSEPKFWIACEIMDMHFYVDYIVSSSSSILMCKEFQALYEVQ